jgi:hypothetical protein
MRPTSFVPATTLVVYSPQPDPKGGEAMHAVVVKVTIDDEEAAHRALQEQVVPAVSQAPGFVAGYWTRKGNSGLSMVVFESEEQANAASERVPGGVPDAVTLESVEVREVAAHA